MSDLTPQQRMFAQEYLADLNGTQAAIRAGYSKRTASAQAARLLTNVNIQAIIQQGMLYRAKRTEITADRVLAELSKIAFSNIKDFVEFKEAGIEESTIQEGDKPIKQRIISASGIRIKPSAEIDGTVLSEVSETKDGLKIKLHDKMKALEMIGRHLVLFTDKTELTGAGGGPVEYTIKLPTGFPAVQPSKEGDPAQDTAAIPIPENPAHDG